MKGFLVALQFLTRLPLPRTAVTDAEFAASMRWFPAVGLVIGAVMIRQYLKDRKSPTTPSGDRLIPGLSIADMRPLQEMAIEQLKLTAIMERIAVSLEKMLIISQERAEDAEIVRRAEIMAQEMLKQLQVTQPQRRRRP